ncbi:hypothetical protein M9H77_33256 [Catharanthus roseus]|uniref:Uncharacterized protein n=1 Tax=Catharanthus roseus TaxID=4058 RepID=A0ACB9ZJ46_CATRO|nr:hypothetical protein M9H77_33256 [Catharanthus roseus]
MPPFALNTQAPQQIVATGGYNSKHWKEIKAARKRKKKSPAPAPAAREGRRRVAAAVTSREVSSKSVCFPGIT